MYPIRVFCCGELMSCNKASNFCETCGSEFNIEGDCVNRVFPWELAFDVSIDDDIIIAESTANIQTA